MANDYKKLCAIVESTKRRKKPLEMLIRMGVDLAGDEDHEPVAQLWLVVMMGDRQLAGSPFDSDDPDAAARDVARQLTLDRRLPAGMDEEDT